MNDVAIQQKAAVVVARNRHSWQRSWVIVAYLVFLGVIATVLQILQSSGVL